jgi:hypothetical protein
MALVCSIGTEEQCERLRKLCEGRAPCALLQSACLRGDQAACQRYEEACRVPSFYTPVPDFYYEPDYYDDQDYYDPSWV